MSSADPVQLCPFATSVMRILVGRFDGEVRDIHPEGSSEPRSNVVNVDLLARVAVTVFVELDVVDSALLVAVCVGFVDLCTFR